MSAQGERLPRRQGAGWNMSLIGRVLLIVGLSALDGFLTLREGGLEIEGNPALRWLMSCDGWIYAFWFHKTVGVGACAWVLGRYRPAFLWLVAVLLAGVFAVHAIVVSWCDGCVVG